MKNKDGEVLILKADSNGTFAGFYDLPGGRIDEDEFSMPLLEILKREIVEETGIEDVTIEKVPVAVGRHCISAKKFPKLEKDIHVLYVFYEAHIDSGKIEISGEHEGFEWVDLENIELESYFTSGILEGVKMYMEKNKI